MDMVGNGAWRGQMGGFLENTCVSLKKTIQCRVGVNSGSGCDVGRGGVGVVTRVSLNKAEMLWVWAKRLTCWAEAGLGCMGTSAHSAMGWFSYVKRIVNEE